MTADGVSSKVCSDGIVVHDELRHRLNDQTPGVTSCAWPGCKDPWIRGGTTSRGTHIPGLRVGILCMSHARQVAEALIQSQVWAERTHEALSKEQQPVDLRGLERLQREQDREADAERRKVGQPGFVYYLQVGERVKVGFSTDVRRRMRQYPPGCRLLAIEPGDYELEKARHRQFAGSRTEGREWFRPTTDLLEHAASLVAAHGLPKHFSHHYRKNENPARVRRSV